MIVVAYLYNLNGMASWCWEAAHALAEAGERVILICDPDVKLPAESAVEIVRFRVEAKSENRSLFGKLSGPLRLSDGSFVRELDLTLRQRGFSPSAYLLNQSDLLAEDIRIPQFVVGWADPPTFGSYAKRILLHGGMKPSRRLIHTALNGLGWYRKDWNAYRTATAVLAVSRRLHASLNRCGVRSSIVQPGTALGPRNDWSGERRGSPRILVAALSLDESRKRIRFLIRTMMTLESTEASVTFVGEASSAIRAEAEGLKIPFAFTGRLDRDALGRLAAEHNLFLFGSQIDDWGYVLVEALAQGLLIVAPNLSPFDEIVGDCGSLFRSGSLTDAAEKLRNQLERCDEEAKSRARDRAERLFSRRAFAEQLKTAMIRGQRAH